LFSLILFNLILSQENNINAFVLLVFAHEGNNIPEAFQLVNYLNKWKDYLAQVKRKNNSNEFLL